MCAASRRWYHLIELLPEARALPAVTTAAKKMRTLPPGARVPLAEATAPKKTRTRSSPATPAKSRAK
jgi:hypothetical protein